MSTFASSVISKLSFHFSSKAHLLKLPRQIRQEVRTQGACSASWRLFSDPELSKSQCRKANTFSNASAIYSQRCASVTSSILQCNVYKCCRCWDQDFGWEGRRDTNLSKKNTSNCLSIYTHSNSDTEAASTSCLFNNRGCKKVYLKTRCASLRI